VNAATRKAYVSVSTGIIEYSLDSFALLQRFTAPTPENFVLDRNDGHLYLPYTLCVPGSPLDSTCISYPLNNTDPPLTDGITVVDTTAAKTWKLVDPAAPSPSAPIGQEVDAMVIDPVLALGAAAVEFPVNATGFAALYVFALGKVASGADATCRMPGRFIDMPAETYTLLTLDQADHLAVIGKEHDSRVAFVDLAKAATGTAVPADFALPLLADGVTPFIHWGDQHSATVGVIGGKPYAFYLSEGWATIARIDLPGVKAIMNGGTGAFAAQVAYLNTGTP
jgi:hypothetical protein